MKRLVACVAVGLLVMGAATCGSKYTSPSPNDSTTSFKGTIAGSGAQVGVLDITLQTVSPTRSSRWLSSIVPPLHAQTVSATGIVRLVGGASTALIGTYDASTKSLAISGGSFTLTGTLANGILAGNYTGPNNATGGFSMLNAANPVTSYCGTFTAGSGGGAVSGVWNLSVAGAAAAGVSVAGQPPVILMLTGQVSGNLVTVTTSAGGTGTAAISGTSLTATGTGNTVVVGTTAACS